MSYVLHLPFRVSVSSAPDHCREFIQVYVISVKSDLVLWITVQTVTSGGESGRCVSPIYKFTAIKPRPRVCFSGSYFVSAFPFSFLLLWISGAGFSAIKKKIITSSHHLCPSTWSHRKSNGRADFRETANVEKNNIKLEKHPHVDLSKSLTHTWASALAAGVSLGWSAGNHRNWV